MAWPTSTFPTALDEITDIVDNVSEAKADDINGAYDAIEKLEAKVGIDSSAVATSLDCRISNLETSVGIIDPSNRTIGDIITEVSAGAMGAIAAVAVGQYFKSAGVATKPAWGKMSLLDTGVKVGLITLTDAAATQAVTGVGFKPSVVIFLSAHTTPGTFDDWSVGFDDGTSGFSIMALNGDAAQSSGYSINHYIDSTHFLSAKITTLGSDGFTLTKYQGATAGSGHSLMVGYLAFP